MAKLKCFTVYDSKVGAFMQPFFMRSKGEALRGWEEAVNDEKTAFSRHPADFTLFEIGEYDEDDGSLLNHSAKTPLGCAIEFRRKPSEQLPLLNTLN